MVETKVFKISGMHCTSCAMNIDGELEDTAGVAEASTNYAKQETRVVYDPALIEPNKIAEIISNVGYTATLV